MKRLFYAAIILIALFLLTFYSHTSVTNQCIDTSNDINDFKAQKISSETLTKSWHERKEKMSLYVNHDFLDQITLYIGQITLGDNREDENFIVACQNIETLLTLIQEEQKLAAHSFY